MGFLATLAVKNLSSRPNSYVIYADKCTLTPEIMRKYGITFKRIPRDITRF
jgi:adenine-specific DNA-methyltransferase